MSRRFIANALMFGAPPLAVIAAFIVGFVSSSGAQGPSRRGAIVVVCLVLALVSAIVGYVLQPRASDDSSRP